MIDPNWSVVDLDPYTWRNIGKYFNPGQYIQAGQPGERALFVLHDDGRLLKVVDTHNGVQPDLLERKQKIENPRLLAQSLYTSGRWERVHVINKQHLAHVTQKAQSKQPDSLDGYYRLIYHLLWDNSDGYVSVPPHPGHWHGWTYQQLEGFMKLLPSPGSLALGVFEGETLNIGLILVQETGLLKTVTTFEALHFSTKVELSSYFLSELSEQLQQKFAPVGAILLCRQTVFDQWLIAKGDKFEVLHEAAQKEQAFWQVLS